jgi:predicted ATPase
MKAAAENTRGSAARGESMINRIRVRNFKSLRDVSVELGSTTVLIGRGGSGKSNFINAIAFFRDYLISKVQAINSWGTAARIYCATAEEPGEMSFEVFLDLPGSDAAFAYKLVFKHSQGNLILSHESFLKNDVPIFSRDGNKWTTEPAVVPIPHPNSLALESINGLPDVAIAYVALTTGIGCYDFGSQVLTHPGDGRKEENGLADDARNSLRAFEAVSRNLHDLSAQQQIVAALRKLKPALNAIQVQMPQRDRIVVSLRMGERALVLNLSQESEGFRRFLAHLIAIYQVPPKQLLMFEEPEKGLYWGALSVLAEHLKACPDAGRGQVVLTTHSPELLDSFDATDIRVVEMDENLETHIGSVSVPQLAALREQLMTTGELLTVDPARMESSAQ